jgi:hypothetical protein
MEVKEIMRKTLITLVMVFVVGISGAWADEDSHYQAAAELLQLAHMDQVLSETIDQMLALQIQQNPQLAPYEKVMKEFFDKYMGWDSLKEDFIRIYMDEFTEAELRDMIEFYKTPTGQKAVMKTPVLAARGAELGQQRVQDNIDELIQMIQAEEKRLKDEQEKMQQEQPQGDDQGETPQGESGQQPEQDPQENTP